MRQMNVWQNGIRDITKTHWNIQTNEKRPGRNAKQKPRRRGQRLFNVPTRDAGAIYFSPRESAARRIRWLLDSKESLSLFLAGVINFRLTLADGGNAPLDANFAPRTAYVAWEPLKRARVRSIRVVGAEVSTPRGRGWTTTRQWPSRKKQHPGERATLVRKR